MNIDMKTTMKHLFQKFFYGVPAAILAGTSLQVAAQEQRPNLLYIFPDQYRRTALSLWNTPEFRNALNTVADPVHTPNLNRLARQGAVFTQVCSTCPMSSPHRAMLMTGMYPSKNGVIMNCYKGREQGVHEDIVGFTDVLAAAGYETAYVGKTHWQRTEALFHKAGNYVGTTEEPGGHYVFDFDTYIPEGRGRKGNKFWFQQLIDNHFNAAAYSNQPALVGGKKDGEIHRPHRFTASVEADVVVDYLKNCDRQRDASKPFSLLWAINPPHPPYSTLAHCDKEVFDKYYKDLKWDEVLLRKNVKYGEDTKVKDAEKLLQTAKIYFSLIKSVDDEIGRVLDTLDKEGLSDNTLVIFASDHGEMLGSHGMLGKGVIYDESLLIPYIIRYPGKLKPQVNDLMFGASDIMPTVLGMLGLGDKLPASVMGTDYSEGILTGNFSNTPKPLSAFYFMPKEKGVRTERYTYLVRQDGSFLLFDNQKDPCQLQTLRLEDIPASDAALLKSELGKWLKVSEDDWAKKKMNTDKIIY